MAIRVSDLNTDNAENSLGMWVNTDASPGAIDLDALLQNDLNDQMIQLDELHTERLRIRASSDANWNQPAGSSGVTDLTGRVRVYQHHRNHEEIEAQAIGADNLFTPDRSLTIESAGPINPHVIGTHVTLSVGTETSTGWTLNKAVATADGATLGYETGDDWWNTTPGFYTFSWYYWADFDGQGQCEMTVNGTTASLVTKDIVRSDGQFQRQWLPFWNPGAMAAKTVTFDHTNQTFASTAHGFVAGDALVLTSSGTTPTGYVAGSLVYVISSGLTANAFKVSTTRGGSSVGWNTDNGTGTITATHVATFQFRQVIGGVNNAKAWVPGFWMLNRGSAPAPWRLPNNTTVSYNSLTASLPADPTNNKSLQLIQPAPLVLAAIPSTGVFAQGQIIWFARPAAGGWLGAICTTGGPVGAGAVFKRFGAIEP